MDAIILVGGQGRRLRPLTATRHKSLVPICHRPAIEYLFDWLRRGGISRAVLAVGQQNDDLAAAYPEGDYAGLQIVHVFERERLESGGAIRHAVRMAGVEGRFLVVNGDVYVDFDLGAALDAHARAGAELTLALYRVEDPSAFGVAVIDESSMVTGFVEKPPPGTAQSDLINAGAWIFEPGLVDEIPPGAVRVEETLFPSLVARGRKMLGYPFEGAWQDVGTPARYLDLVQQLVAGGGCEALAPTASIAADTTIVRSTIGEDSVIEAGATVEGSIVWEHVRIGTGARIVDSIIADHAVVGDGAAIEGAVIGSGAQIAAGASVPRGALIDTHERVDAS